MLVILNNTTNNPLPYTSINLTVAPMASVTLTPAQLVICQDPQLQSDIFQENITVSDGVTTYTVGGAINYLNFIASVQIAANGFSKSILRIPGNGTTNVKSIPGFLHGIFIGNNTTGGTAAVYDGLNGTGTNIMNLTFGTTWSSALGSTGQLGSTLLAPLGLKFATALSVVTAGSTSNDISVIFL